MYYYQCRMLSPIIDFLFLLINCLWLKELFAPWGWILQIPWPLYGMATAVCVGLYSLFSQRSFLPFHLINLALSTSSLMFWCFESTIQQYLILLFHFHTCEWGDGFPQTDWKAYGWVCSALNRWLNRCLQYCKNDSRHRPHTC